MENPKICDICQGSGEVSFFKGESRFLISQETCPACNGSGFSSDEDNTTKKQNNGNKKQEANND